MIVLMRVRTNDSIGMTIKSVSIFCEHRLFLMMFRIYSWRHELSFLFHLQRFYQSISEFEAKNELLNAKSAPKSFIRLASFVSANTGCDWAHSIDFHGYEWARFSFRRTLSMQQSNCLPFTLVGQCVSLARKGKHSEFMAQRWLCMFECLYLYICPIWGEPKS